VIGIVVVSHSRTLAQAAVELATEMVPGNAPAVAVAAGLDDGAFGTDAVAVQAAIEQVDSPDGVVVLCDLGSAVLSAEMALEFLDEDLRSRVVISPAPLVEGLVVALVTAAGGASASEVAAEAANALAGKISQLGGDLPTSPTAGGVPTSTPTEARAGDEGPPAASATFVVTNAHGLHARPAARLVSTVRRFDARVWLRSPRTGAAPVLASSLSAVATLGALQGDELELAAWGPDAKHARDAVMELAERGFDDVAEPAVANRSAAGPTAGPVGAAPGVAIGPAHVMEGGRPSIPDHEPGAPDAQWTRLTNAVELARGDIDATRRRVAAAAGDTDAAIFDAHALLLDDPTLLDDVRSRIDAGAGAAQAWVAVMAQTAANLAELADSYQRGRAADIRSVADLVLRNLVGAPTSTKASGVVVATDLTPAEAADLDRDTVQAVVLASGSPTSHAAILARAYGIPMVTGAGTAILSVAEGTQLAVDGDRGEVAVDPSEQVLSGFRERIAARHDALAAAAAMSVGPAVTRDGAAITVAANIGSVDDARAAGAAHADGSGLVRTEFLFVGKTVAPTRDEQERVYRAIAENLQPGRVVLRTLDVGGDKPLPFLRQAAEANPFLGERGIRLTLRHPDLFLDQLVAMCAVARDHPVSVMFPMVATVSEVIAARQVVDAAIAEVGGRPESLRIGIMIEVPSAALKAATFVPHVDFFSVGTNDLTQYALAAERGNQSVAELADGLDPGVLRLIATLCNDAGPVPVSVCGELAADPIAVPILLGLGVRSLSVVPPAIALVKQRVREIDLGEARRLGTEALGCGSAAQVRALVNSPQSN
jgi:phosphoenolpyruvate-protein phosphotransferase/dihydroxyacetone kinase phosphotransfer subunit